MVDFLLMKDTDVTYFVSTSPAAGPGPQCIQVQANTRPPDGRVVAVVRVELSLDTKEKFEEYYGPDGYKEIESLATDLCRRAVKDFPG